DPMGGQCNHGGWCRRLAANLARSTSVATGLRRRTATRPDPPLAAWTTEAHPFVARAAHVRAVVAVAGVRAHDRACHVQWPRSRRRCTARMARTDTGSA